MGAEGVVNRRGTLPRDMRRYNRHVVMIKMGIKASIVQTVTIFAKAGNVLLRPGWIISSDKKGQSSYNSQNDQNGYYYSNCSLNFVPALFGLTDVDGVIGVDPAVVADAPGVITSGHKNCRSEISPSFKKEKIKNILNIKSCNRWKKISWNRAGE